MARARTPFAKVHGLGNDFVLVDLRAAPAGDPALDGGHGPAFARKVCDRHRGIGADGVLTLLPANIEEAKAASQSGARTAARLVIHNPDGSRPEMCGNGARAAALWLATDACKRPALPGTQVLLLTDAGPRPCSVEAAAPGLGEVEVGMGEPKLSPAIEPALQGGSERAVPVSMGNPHLVFFADQFQSLARPGVLELARTEGPGLCSGFDANIEFVERLGPQRFKAAVWERGAGLTQACGTGACAVAAAAVSLGLASGKQPITVELPGGPLVLRFEGKELRMRGPAELVFWGDL
jgi:diaminopimelate epimerase